MECRQKVWKFEGAWTIDKAELLKEGVSFLIHLFARDILVMKKLEIEKTKLTALLLSVLKVEYCGGLYILDF